MFPILMKVVMGEKWKVWNSNNFKDRCLLHILMNQIQTESCRHYGLSLEVYIV